MERSEARRSPLPHGPNPVPPTRTAQWTVEDATTPQRGGARLAQGPSGPQLGGPIRRRDLARIAQQRQLLHLGTAVRRTAAALALFGLGLTTGGCAISDVACDGRKQAGEASVDARFDRDGDGYFDASDAGCVEVYGPRGLLDCDDRDPAVHPGAPERACNGLDDDCDPTTPDGEDADRDGSLHCDDCDEMDAARHPDHEEICDNIDNNCDERVDEDADGDGFDACADCDNARPWVYPQAYELCDGLDSDCDGDADHPGEELGDPRLCIDDPVSIRIVAANLSSGPSQSYQDPGIRILQGLQPDIVLIQEFDYLGSSLDDLREFIERSVGADFSFARIQAPGITLPNGVISRWPIAALGSWEDTVVSNRNFLWARIPLPSGHSLWCVSVHWKSGGSSTSDRREQARQLVDHIARDVPDGDLLVVGGDLNTQGPNETSMLPLVGVVSFSHIPVDEDGNRNTNAPRNRPYDWVLPDEDLELYHVPVRLAGIAFPHGLVFDSRVFSAPVPPVQPEDSGAVNMQHMAVVKDFVIDWNPE
jgi:endonuclease/exonuclease/phosphatase family metal-dependent hydrolase